MANPIFLPRGTLPPDYGERLRAAGLNEGISFGGSEITPRDDLPPEIQAQLLALASNPSPTGPTITNADIARFLAQQNPGILAGLPSGGDAANPGPGVSPGARGGGEAQAGRGTAAATPSAAPAGANPFGGITFSGENIGRAAGGILGTVGGGFLGPAGSLTLGPAGGLIGGQIGKAIENAARFNEEAQLMNTIGRVRETPAPEPTPMPQNPMPEQEPPTTEPDPGQNPGKGEEAPTNENEGALGTGGGPGQGAPGGPGPSSDSPGGQAGNADTGGGTGGGPGASGSEGDGSGTGAGTGGEGPEARGGRIPARWRNPSPALSRGTWKGAKKFHGGGRVGETVASPDPETDTAYYPLQESWNSYAERQDRLGTPESKRYRDANEKRNRPSSIPKRDKPGGWLSKPEREYGKGGPVSERDARLQRIRNFEARNGRMAI